MGLLMGLLRGLVHPQGPGSLLGKTGVSQVAEGQERAGLWGQGLPGTPHVSAEKGVQVGGPMSSSYKL